MVNGSDFSETLRIAGLNFLPAQQNEGLDSKINVSI